MKNEVLKKICGLLVAFALVVLCAVLLPIEAQAAASETTSGTHENGNEISYNFKLDAPGNVAITFSIAALPGAPIVRRFSTQVFKLTAS